MIFYWISVPFIYCMGFMSAVALRELKRMSWEHYLMNPPPLTESQKEILACNAKNNAEFNAEVRENKAQQKRKDFRIVKG